MLTCPQCSRAREPDFRFCPRCGAAFAAAPAAGPDPAAHGAPSARGRGAAVEEHKHATVMFVDICGSTERVASAAPEDARRFLRSAIALMKEVIESERFDGYVSQTRGDGVVALFGAPVAQEDHALRACRAAIELQRRCADRAAGLQIRIGIDSGKLVVGPDEYGVVQADGVAVHRASRLEQLALAGKVLISGDTWRLTGGRVAATALGWRSIRGLAQTELFELRLTAGQASSAAWARDRYLSRDLVGRAALLDALEQTARAGGGLRALALRGEAGIGKSRLLAELFQRVAPAFAVAHAVALPAEARHRPLRLIADLMRSLLEASGPADPVALRGLIEGWQAPLGSSAAAVIDLLDLGDGGAEWRALTPAQRMRRSGEALLALLRTRLADGPLLLAVEDLFHADASSLRVLDTVLRQLAAAPLLLCMTYRPDFVAPWAGAPWFAEHAVGPLEAAATLRLAHQLLGPDAATAALADRLVARAEGNPLFLEQMVLALVDEGALIGAPGAYRSARPVGDLAVPPSISALINARVDRLPADAKLSLEAAAVLGEPITADLVAAMRQVPVEAVDDDLNVAVDAGLLAPPVPGRPVRFGFRHALVHEVVQGALTRLRRRTLHAAAFGALRDHLGAQVDDHAAVLAHHAARGELWREAAEYALRSLSRAVARSANRDALRVYQLGLDALDHLDAGPTRLALELGLRLEALGAMLPLGQMDGIVATLEKAGALTRELGDRRREAAVLVQLAVMLWAGGGYGRGLLVADRAAAAAAQAGSRSLQMAAAQARMMLAHGLGRYRRVIEDACSVQASFAAELGARKLMPGWAVIAAVNLEVFLADALRHVGQRADAQRACDAAYAQLAGQDHPFSRVLVDFAQAALWLEAGRTAEAVALLEAAARSCEVNDVPTMAPAIVAELGGALARGGRVAEALSLLEDAVERRMHLVGGRYNDFYLPLNHARALAAAGRIDDALVAALRAEAAAAHHGQCGHQAEAQALLAECLLQAGRAADAARTLAQARRMATACDMSTLAARVTQRLAQLPAAQVGSIHG